MAKILIAFVVVAGAALMLLMDGGGDISLGGEQHGVETHAAASGDSKAEK